MNDDGGIRQQMPRFQLGELRTRRGRCRRPAVAVANALRQVHEPGVDEPADIAPLSAAASFAPSDPMAPTRLKNPLAAKVHAFDVSREKRIVRRIRSRRPASSSFHPESPGLAELDHVDQAAQGISCRQDRRRIRDQAHRFHRLRHPRRIPLVTVGIRLSAQRSPERWLPMRRRRLPQRQDVVKRMIVQVDQPRVDVRMRAERRAEDTGQVDTGGGLAPRHTAAMRPSRTSTWPCGSRRERRSSSRSCLRGGSANDDGDAALTRRVADAPVARIRTADKKIAADFC